MAAGELDGRAGALERGHASTSGWIGVAELCSSRLRRREPNIPPCRGSRPRSGGRSTSTAGAAQARTDRQHLFTPLSPQVRILEIAHAACRSAEASPTPATRGLNHPWGSVADGAPRPGRRTRPAPSSAMLTPQAFTAGWETLMGPHAPALSPRSPTGSLGSTTNPRPQPPSALGKRVSLPEIKREARRVLRRAASREQTTVPIERVCLFASGITPGKLSRSSCI
jgi:hypothetical protein